MAKFDYVKAHAVAEKLINLFGESGQAIKKGNSSGVDGQTGALIPATPDVIIDGVVTPKIDFKQSEIDGESTIIGDSYCFFESDISPEIDYMITIGSDTFRVTAIKKLESVNSIHVYRRLSLRK